MDVHHALLGLRAGLLRLGPLYQKQLAARTQPADRRERLVTAYSVAVLLAFVVGAFLTPPDPFTQVLTFPALFVGTFVLSFLLVSRDSVGSGGGPAG